MKLKNIFSNSNKYFIATGLEPTTTCSVDMIKTYSHIFCCSDTLCIYILYIYHVYIYYIILYILCIYQQGFPYCGIGGNQPNSQKFAHSPCT